MEKGSTLNFVCVGCVIVFYKTHEVTLLEITGTTTVVLVSRGACLKPPRKKVSDQKEVLL